jgi:hypothetical protein
MSTPEPSGRYLLYEYETPGDWALQADFDASAHADLEHLRVGAPPGPSEPGRVYARFKNVADAAPKAARLAAELGLGAKSLIWSGPWVADHLPRVPWLERAGRFLSKAFPSILAFLGGIALFQHYYAQLFAPPDVAIKVSAAPFEPNAPITHTLTFQNLSHFADASLRFKGISLEPAPGRAGQMAEAEATAGLNMEDVNPLAPLGHATGTFSLPVLPPGKHVAHLHFEVASGLLWPNRDVDKVVTLEVWDVFAHSRSGAPQPQPTLLTDNLRTCKIPYEFRFGHAVTKEKEIQIKLPVSRWPVHLKRISFGSELTAWSELLPPSNAGSTILVHLSSAPKLTPVKAALVLELDATADPDAVVDWAAVAELITIDML